MSFLKMTILKNPFRCSIDHELTNKPYHINIYDKHRYFRGNFCCYNQGSRTLKIEASGSSKQSVHMYQTTQRSIPEHHNICPRCYQNLGASRYSKDANSNNVLRSIGKFHLVAASDQLSCGWCYDCTVLRGSNSISDDKLVWQKISRPLCEETVALKS
jgi:hypothetical protein